MSVGQILTGTPAGLNSTTGNFTGNVSAASCTLSGGLTAATAQLSGALSAGAVSGTTGTFSGAVSGTSGTFTGGVTAVPPAVSSLGQTSFNNQALSGVNEMTGGDVSGLDIRATLGPLLLSAPANNAGSEVLITGTSTTSPAVGIRALGAGANDIGLNANQGCIRIVGGPLSAVAPYPVNELQLTGDSSAQINVVGSLGGTFTLTKFVNTVIPVDTYLEVNFNGNKYYIPLMPSNPSNT